MRPFDFLPDSFMVSLNQSFFGVLPSGCPIVWVPCPPCKALCEVVLITNAERGWIELSCQKFLPTLFPVLESVKASSAHSIRDCGLPHGSGSNLSQDMDRWCRSMLPFARVPFRIPSFDPQPHNPSSSYGCLRGPKNFPKGTGCELVRV